MEESFAMRLQKLRKEKGWSRKMLAKKIGVAPDTIKYWEEEISQPRISRGKQLAKVFGVTVDYISGNGDEI
jgi:DNA-binding XRE family transcriptional regulator